MYLKQEAGYFKPLEFGKTTVYKRMQPKFYNEDDEELTEEEFNKLSDGKRVTYYEKQLSYSEYYQMLEEENAKLKLALVESDIENRRELLEVKLAIAELGMEG